MMGRARIEIHLTDTENGGTKIQIRGDYSDGHDVSWDNLQARAKAGLLQNGAEKLTYRTIVEMQNLLAKFALPTIQPAPKVILPKMVKQ